MSTQKLKQMIGGAERIVAFTGAGISAESGIPTYRGADGVWNKYDPNKYANVNYFFQDPTPLDDRADLVIRESASSVLSGAVEE